MAFPIADAGSISAATAAMPAIAELTGTDFFYFSADYPSGIRQDQQQQQYSHVYVSLLLTRSGFPPDRYKMLRPTPLPTGKAQYPQSIWYFLTLA